MQCGVKQGQCIGCGQEAAAGCLHNTRWTCSHTDDGGSSALAVCVHQGRGIRLGRGPGGGGGLWGGVGGAGGGGWGGPPPPTKKKKK